MLRVFAVFVGVVVVLLGCAESAAARAVVVPDSFPTIQAAVNAVRSYFGADTVLVRSGRYEEDVVCDRGIVLLPYPGDPYADDAFPQMGALLLAPQDPAVGGSEIRGFRFRGAVRILAGEHTPTMNVRVEDCRMDSGLVVSGMLQIFSCHVIGCTVAGGMEVRSGGSAHVRLNSVQRGGILVVADGYFTIEGNTVTGPAPFGIWANDYGGMSSIVGNVVSGTETGIQVFATAYRRVTDNEVSDCTGPGFVQTGASAGSYARNTALRCAGRGFDLQFDPQRTGAFSLAGNRAVSCGGEGFVVDRADAQNNVAGRCGGAGFDIGQATLVSNTSYSNQGAGYVVRTSGTVTNDIGFGNAGYGLSWLAGVAPASIGCNDWNANTAGAVSGAAPGATDVNLPPYFCNLVADDVHLSADSPLLDLVGCGLVGALGQGCGAAVSVPVADAQAATFTVGPNPTVGPVRFGWAGSVDAAMVEVFDVTGARRWSETLAPGAHSLQWGAVDSDGRRLPAGVYYARLVGARIAFARRIVLVR